MSEIVIERRYNFDDYEQIATYDPTSGELDGDDDFAEAFGYLFDEERYDEDLILDRFSGPNLIASIPGEGEEGESEGERVEASASNPETPETVEIGKYRVYLSEAEDLAEAEEMSPDWANIQEGSQGGFFYDTEDDPDKGDDGDDPEFEGIVSGGVEDGGFDVNRDVDPEDIEAGDNVYVSHPDSANYIAEVDSVNVYDDGGWTINFGGGSYTLRPDTNSTYEGRVEEEPELGEYEEVQSVADTGDLDEGDVVAYTDPAGYQHYEEVEGIGVGGSVETAAGELDYSEVDGQVVINDPVEQYDLPSEDEIEENTAISNTSAARTFVEEVAKATAEGDASSVSCRDYQYYVGAIQSEEMMIDVYRSAVNNDASATHRDKIESRMRNMGLDPEEHHPANLDFDPDEVPAERSNTKYSNFTSERATEATAHVIQENNISSSNWQKWNDFFDHMTDPELEEAAVKALTTEIDRDNWGSDPMEYEGDDMSESATTPSLSEPARENVASCLTRIGRDDPQRQREVYDRLQEETPAQHEEEVAHLGATWMHDADVRREIFEEDLGGSPSGIYDKRRYTMQFSGDHEERAEAFISRYVGSTSSTDTQFARMALTEYGENTDADLSRFNKAMATESVEPTEEFVETIDELRDQTAEYIEEEYDGEVQLKRGVADPITSNAAAESWSTKHATASQFDGHAIMEATFEPGDVIACNEISEHYDWGYSKHSSEKEWTVLGGPLAEAVPEDMKPNEFFDEDELDVDEDPEPTADL